MGFSFPPPSSTITPLPLLRLLQKLVATARPTLALDPALVRFRRARAVVLPRQLLPHRHVFAAKEGQVRRPVHPPREDSFHLQVRVAAVVHETHRIAHPCRIHSIHDILRLVVHQVRDVEPAAGIVALAGIRLCFRQAFSDVRPDILALVPAQRDTDVR